MRRATIAVAFGGGGGFGVGFNRGVVDGLREGGIDLSHSPMLGTSAGAITMASLAGDLSFGELMDAWEHGAAKIDDDWWLPAIEVTRPIFGRLDPAAFRAPIASVSVQLPAKGRVVMPTDAFALPDLIAASCSVPPVIRPHRVGRTLYLDGGVASNVSADLAPPADLLLVTNPLVNANAGLLARYNERKTTREMAAWAEQHGGQALLIVPNDEIGRGFSPRLSDIANVSIGRQIYPASVAYGRLIADELRRVYPQLVAAAS